MSHAVTLPKGTASVSVQKKNPHLFGNLAFLSCKCCKYNINNIGVMLKVS